MPTTASSALSSPSSASTALLERVSRLAVRATATQLGQALILIRMSEFSEIDLFTFSFERKKKILGFKHFTKVSKSVPTNKCFPTDAGGGGNW